MLSKTKCSQKQESCAHDLLLQLANFHFLAFSAVRLNLPGMQILVAQLVYLQFG